MRPLATCVLLTAAAGITLGQERLALPGIAPIERRIPPTNGVFLDPALEAELKERATRLSDKVWEIDFKQHTADAGVLVKAVEFALKHGEFYSEKEIPVAVEMLDLAEARIKELENETKEKPTWLSQSGSTVRGYRSSIDDTYQPYGLFIPEKLDLSEPVSMLVWLHGRGDKITDLHFLKRCLTKSQAFGGFVEGQQDAIILYPFGRHCVGWKHAGEIDVFEAIEAVKRDYPIDDDRIALAGFSMGGAGAWHIGAHYRDRFCAVHAGAGFAETKEYNGLTPEGYPSVIEQTLWQVYDVPEYAKNFLNGPLIAYSGAEDKQKQAADLMARQMKQFDYELRHVVGEGMGHKYNERSVAEIWASLQEAWQRGRDSMPHRVIWQTPTLRYPGNSWLQVTGLDEHWEGALVEGRWDKERKVIDLDLENIRAIEILGSEGRPLTGYRLQIGEQSIEVQAPGFPVEGVGLIRENGNWQLGEWSGLKKRPGLQGPIDDAFMSRFVVVSPNKVPSPPQLARWVGFEIDHFRDRWSALMRGKMIERRASSLNSRDVADANLILWGDPDSNPVIAEMVEGLPIQWRGGKFTFRGETYDANNYVAALIFPNPLNPQRYVVINSGLTFREGHDRTNSLQNPKLGDWAIIGLDQDPDNLASGRIESSGFFDENWK